MHGSAVDAMIATGLCNSILNVQSGGIGGGHFMNIYIKSEKHKSYYQDKENCYYFVYLGARINRILSMPVKRPLSTPTKTCS
jgi:hypothetical protein